MCKKGQIRDYIKIILTTADLCFIMNEDPAETSGDGLSAGLNETAKHRHSVYCRYAGIPDSRKCADAVDRI